MASFIQRADPAKTATARINELEALVLSLRAQLNHAEAAAMVEPEPEEEECLECNLCALEEACRWAGKDLSESQSVYRDEVCGHDYEPKFCNNGLADVWELIQCIAYDQVCDNDLDLAIASYNLALCKSQGVAERMAASKCELEAWLTANPDADPHCIKFVAKILNAC